jgi:hypothetical protein
MAKKKIFLSILTLHNAAMGIFFSCRKEKSFESCKETNKPPIAIAGPDQVITLPAGRVCWKARANINNKVKLLKQ